jgi:predicted nucleotide-binding protein
MHKIELLEKLSSFRDRLKIEVVQAYGQRGSSFGEERFSAWRAQFSKFLDLHLPGSTQKLNAKLDISIHTGRLGESNISRFMRYEGDASFAFIDSLLLDVKNDEADLLPPAKVDEVLTARAPSLSNKRVFIVHGHDELIKTKVARFVEKLGYEAIILHEMANKGMTIIEKFEANTDVGFAIVLYTGDDQGNTAKAAADGNLNARARQNVVFEHGYLLAKLTRSNVVALVSKGVELPSDIHGVVNVVNVDNANWQNDIAKEMEAAGYAIDFNKLITH